MLRAGVAQRAGAAYRQMRVRIPRARKHAAEKKNGVGGVARARGDAQYSVLSSAVVCSAASIVAQ